MSTTVKDGGPAFPGKRWVLAVDGSPHLGGALEHVPGMSLRDYFAAQAMAALIGIVPDGTAFGPSHPEQNAGLARCAYTLADAMLKARSA